jgi:signal recognition particle subunit SEC65
MSYPVPSIDPSEKKYPSDDYTGASKVIQKKKKKMAKKMSLMEKLRKEIKSSEHTRKHPFSSKPFADLPPGYHDSDNE